MRCVFVFGLYCRPCVACVAYDSLESACRHMKTDLKVDFQAAVRMQRTQIMRRRSPQIKQVWPPGSADTVCPRRPLMTQVQHWASICVPSLKFVGFAVRKIWCTMCVSINGPGDLDLGPGDL